MTYFERFQKMDIFDFAMYIEANGCENCPIYRRCDARNYIECVEDIEEWLGSEVDDEQIQKSQG